MEYMKEKSSQPTFKGQQLPRFIHQHFCAHNISASIRGAVAEGESVYAANTFAARFQGKTITIVEYFPYTLRSDVVVAVLRPTTTSFAAEKSSTRLVVTHIAAFSRLHAKKCFSFETFLAAVRLFFGRRVSERNRGQIINY